MKHTLRRLIALLAAGTLAAAAAGCGADGTAAPSSSGAPAPEESGGSPATSGEPSSASAQETGELTIFARTGPDSSEWLRTVAESFTAETGIKVNWIEQGQSGYFTNITNQLVAGTDSFDLGVTNSTYVGPWAYSGYIDPLDDYIANFPADYDMDDLAFSYQIDGKTFAIPYSISAHMLYYRSDLIDTPPTTWDEMIETAKNFTQSINGDSATKYGLAWTAKAGPEQPKTFYNFLWSLGGDIEADGKAAIASEAGLKAGEYWENIVKSKVAPPDIANYSYSETLDALNTGIVAMAAPYWSAGYSDIQKGDSPYKDSIKVALLPGAKQADGSVNNTVFNHSYTLVLNKNAKNKETAMKYYEYLCNKQNQLEYAKINGFPARYSALKDPTVDQEFFSVAQKSLEYARFEPLVPYYLEQHDIVNIALSGIMTGTMPYQQALETAQSDLQILYDSYNK